MLSGSKLIIVLCKITISDFKIKFEPAPGFEIWNYNFTRHNYNFVSAYQFDLKRQNKEIKTKIVRRSIDGSIVQHCFQERDLDVCCQLIEDSSNGRESGYGFGSPNFTSRYRFEFFSWNMKVKNHQSNLGMKNCQNVESPAVFAFLDQDYVTNQLPPKFIAISPPGDQTQDCCVRDSTSNSAPQKRTS